MKIFISKIKEFIFIKVNYECKGVNNMSIEDIKIELDKLCMEYISILKNMKDNDIITDDEFKNCIENKLVFVENQF
jgi:hypothetical protein